MSINVGSAIAYLDLDTQKFNAGLGSATAKQNAFQKETASAGARLDGFGKKTVSAGTALTVGLTAPILAAGVAMIKTVAEFDSKISNVKALLGSTASDTKMLRDEAIKLGADSVYSASQAAEGMANLASAGFSVQEVMAAMPGLLDMAASSGTDLATASDIAASSVRGFGLEAKDTSHVADVFAQAAASTNAGVVDMGEAMKYIAPVANSFNLKIEEVAAAVGEMSNAGIKGSQAGTTLRGALARLAKPSDAAAMAMGRIGFNAFDSSGKMKPLATSIGELKSGMKNLTQEEQANALVTIFGQESLSGMMVLIKQGPDALSKLTKELVGSDGAAKKMAGTMQDNLKGSVNQFMGAIESASIKMVDNFTPALKGIVDQVTKVIQAFTKLTPQQMEMVAKLAGFAAAAGPALIVIGKMAEGMGALSTFMGIAKGSVLSFATKGSAAIAGAGKGFAGAMAQFSNLGGIKAMGSGLDIVKTKVAGFTKGSIFDFGKMSSGIKSKIGEANASLTSKMPEGLRLGLARMSQAVTTETPKLKNLFGTIGGGITNGLKTLVGASLKVLAPAVIIGTLIVGLGLAYQQFGPQIDAVIQTIITKGPAMIASFTAGIVSKIPELMAAGTSLLIKLVEAIIANLPALIKAAADIIASLVNGLAKNIPKLIPVMISLISTLATAIIKNLPTIIKAGLNLIVALAQSFANNIDKVVAEIVKIIIMIAKIIIQNLPMLIEAGIKILVALIKGIAKAIPQLVAAIPKIVKAIWNEITKVNWGDLGHQIISGIGKGIEYAARGLFDTVKNVAKGALNAAKSFFGIHSPSTVFRDSVGKQIPAGISEGIESAKGLINSSLFSMAASVTAQPVIGAIINNTAASNGNNKATPQLTSTSTTTVGSLMHVDKLVLANDMDIQATSAKLEFYADRLKKAKGER